jgi:hypothetical protein
VHLRAALAAGGDNDFFHFLDDAFELGGRKRLEDDRRPPGRGDPVLGLERDVGRGDRKQPVGGGPLDLVAAGEDVFEPHQRARAQRMR